MNRAALGLVQFRVRRLEMDVDDPIHHEWQRKLRQQLPGPRSGGDDDMLRAICLLRRADLDAVPIPGPGYDRFRAVQICSRSRGAGQERADARFRVENPRIRLDDTDQVSGRPQTWVSRANSLRGDQFIRQTVETRTLERTDDVATLRGADEIG